MNLFDTVKGDIFSVLASPKRRFYAEALDVLWEVYQDHLKIPEESYFTALYQRLESNLEEIDFLEEDMYEDERNSIQGKVRYIIRLLDSKGWVKKEFGESGKFYFTVPSYNGKLLELFHNIGNQQTERGFSYVYGSYSTLKIADMEGSPVEKREAIHQAFLSTQDLLQLLKNVYHSIESYFDVQAESNSANEILANHYDEFGLKVMERHIKPLRIKDSIPKYRVPVQEILSRWMENKELMEAMSQISLNLQQSSSLEEAHSELLRKMFWIKEQYDTIEQEILLEIDQQVRKFTRSYAQKMEYLLNQDQDIKGNLLYLLNTLGSGEDTGHLCQEIGGALWLPRQRYLSERSLYQEKTKSKSKLQKTLTVKQESLSKEAFQEMADFFQQRYGIAEVFAYMERLFGEKQEIYTQNFPLQEEEGYIMCILALLHEKDRKSFYTVEMLSGDYRSEGYLLPQLQFKRKGKTFP